MPGGHRVVAAQQVPAGGAYAGGACAWDAYAWDAVGLGQMRVVASSTAASVLRRKRTNGRPVHKEEGSCSDAAVMR